MALESLERFEKGFSILFQCVNYCLTNFLLDKAAVLFRVITTSTQIPFSWRLASSKDLKNSMGEVKFVLNHVSGWVIAKLVDGQIGGRSYHFQIRTDIKGGSYGHQLIVNNGENLFFS